MQTPAPMLVYSMTRALEAYRQQCHVVRVLSALGHGTTSEIYHAVIRAYPAMNRSALERHLTRLRKCALIVAWPTRGSLNNPQGVLWTVAGSPQPVVRRVHQVNSARMAEKQAGSWWLGRPREGFTQTAANRWR